MKHSHLFLILLLVGLCASTWASEPLRHVERNTPRDTPTGTPVSVTNFPVAENGSLSVSRLYVNQLVDLTPGGPVNIAYPDEWYSEPFSTANFASFSIYPTGSTVAGTVSCLVQVSFWTEGPFAFLEDLAANPTGKVGTTYQYPSKLAPVNGLYGRAVCYPHNSTSSSSINVHVLLRAF